METDIALMLKSNNSQELDIKGFNLSTRLKNILCKLSVTL